MAIVIEKGNFSDKITNSVVYLFCVDSDVETISVEHLCFLKVRCRCAHIALINNLSVRRMVFLADNDVTTKLAIYESPLLIDITTCCDMKVGVFQ